MKKSIYLLILLLMAGLCIGCGKAETESNDVSTENRSSQAEEPSSPVGEENRDIQLNDNLNVDFTYDYSEDIGADIDCVVSGSASLQKELENIEKVAFGTDLVILQISRQRGRSLQNRGTG